MWKPDKPIVSGSTTLSDQEAWWNEFVDEFHELCGGEVDHEWLVGLAGVLYDFNIDRAPREAAKLALVTLAYELPGPEHDEPLIPQPSRSRPDLH